MKLYDFGLWFRGEDDNGNFFGHQLSLKHKLFIFYMTGRFWRAKIISSMALCSYTKKGHI
jgi:hypothetical protein